MTARGAAWTQPPLVSQPAGKPFKRFVQCETRTAVQHGHGYSTGVIGTKPGAGLPAEALLYLLLAWGRGKFSPSRLRGDSDGCPQACWGDQVRTVCRPQYGHLGFSCCRIIRTSTLRREAASWRGQVICPRSQLDRRQGTVPNPGHFPLGTQALHPPQGRHRSKSTATQVHFFNLLRFLTISCQSNTHVFLQLSTFLLSTARQLRAG